MKSFKLLYFMSLFGIMLHTNIHALDTVITLFIKEIEEDNTPEIDDRPVESVSEKLTQPSYVFGNRSDQSFLKSNGIDGVTAMYLGYMTTSNKNGQISFPRKQQSDQIYLIITPRIIPTFMVAPALIHHWQVDPTQPVAMYEINRKKDKKLNAYYFDVVDAKEAMNDPRTDKKTAQMYRNILLAQEAIPLNSIVLFADPKNIIVPVGITQNNYSPNFILPNLSARKVDMTENSLDILSRKQYFEQINIASKNDSPNIATIIMNQ